MAQPLETKLTYRPSRKLQVFFTGGAARVSRDGKLLVCACGDEAKVRIDGVAGHRYRRAIAAVKGCEQEHACMGCWVVCLALLRRHRSRDSSTRPVAECGSGGVQAQHRGSRAVAAVATGIISQRRL